MKKKVYAYLHTHWDMEWYRDKQDFDIRLVDVFDVVIEEIENNRAPFFYFDGQVVALLNYLKIRPEKKQTILKLIQENKLAIGPFLVSADTYLVNFISMLKNLEIGMKYSKEFGQKDYIGYICDVFGVSNSIFEAMKLKNIKSTVIWRGVNPKKVKNNANFIKNDIKTLWLTGGYFNDFLHCENINIDAFKKYLDKISKYSPNIMLLPVGADHLGILRNANEKIKQINKQLTDYEIILTNPFEYFKDAEFKNVTKEEEFLDNSDTYILGGVYSSRINQKIKNAIIQNKVSRIIEPLNFYLGEKYEKNISQLWETLIQNHAHDGIYGCSIDKVAYSVDCRFDRCENILDSIEKNIIQNFKRNNSKSKKSLNSLGFFNLSNKNNIKTIEVKLPYILDCAQVLDFEEKFLDEHLTDIYKVPVTEEITKIYRQLVEISDNKKHSFSSVQILKPVKKVKISKNSIENDFIQLKIKNKKIFVTDKKTNKMFELVLTDIKDKGDSYNFAPCGEYKKFELLNSKVIYDGKIESLLQLQFKNIKLDIKLDNCSEILRFVFVVNNKTKNHKIQLVVKTEKNIAKTISKDAIGTIERKIDFDYKMQDFMPVEKPFELKTNSYPMQDFVLANGIYILTKGLNEYEIYKNELRICLLRCFGILSNPKNPARYVPAGPGLKTPKGQMFGKNVCEFAIAFGNSKEAFLNADEFYKNYEAIDGEYDMSVEFLKLKEEEVFYGISEDKKIIYNLKNKKIQMI